MNTDMEGLRKRNGAAEAEIEEICGGCQKSICECPPGHQPEEDFEEVPRLCHFNDQDLRTWFEEDRNFEWPESVGPLKYGGYWEDKTDIDF